MSHNLNSSLEAALEAYSRGEYTAAKAAVQSWLLEHPQDAQGLNLVGVCAYRLGQFEQAIHAYEQALARDPKNADVFYNLGHAHRAQEQYAAALSCYSRVLSLDPQRASAYNLAGLMQEAMGDWPAAQSSFQEALRLQPENIDASINLANGWAARGDYDAASALFHQALALQPAHALLRYNLGSLMLELGQVESALEHLRAALELQPDLKPAWNDLGKAWQQQLRFAEAQACYDRALTLEPSYVPALNNASVLAKERRDYSAALGYANQALALAPLDTETRWNHALLLLSLGRYEEAWPDYEARLDPGQKHPIARRPNLEGPVWQGEDLHGRSLLVWSEQGLGDAIMCWRFVHDLLHRGARLVTWVCQAPLLRLFKEQAPDGVQVLLADQVGPKHAHDYWVMCMSLPGRCGASPASLSQGESYVHIKRGEDDRWSECLPRKGLKVGLVWKGSAAHQNDAQRSLPHLSALAALWEVPGVSFISLQKGAGEVEASVAPATQPILQLGSQLEDFADVAQALAHLDLLVCVDTAIAHLAGAMSLACWVLLPAVGVDWRWGVAGEHSVWYPQSLRLWRQPAHQDWAELVREVAGELARFAP